MRQKRRRFVCKVVIIISVLIVFLCGCGEAASEVELTEISTEEKSVESEQTEGETDSKEEENVPEELYVYVCGEVRNPGVYKLNPGDRITHALQAAGGMTQAAADTYLNQAELLADGQKIYVPDQEEVKESEIVSEQEKEKVSDGKVNINTAEKTELLGLSGIGESRADAILTYREENGGFSSVDEIKQVEGIKDGIFEKIKDQIKIE